MAYISIGVLSAIIQFLIIKGKNTATLFIDKNNLTVNELFLKSYNLETLKSIIFDSFDEIYIIAFANSKRIKIEQEDFRQDDINNFIAAMVTKSKCNVVLSDNIKNEITAANIGLCASSS